MRHRITKITAIILATFLVLELGIDIGYAKNTEEYYDAQIKTANIGGYTFEVESHEEPSNEYLPIIGKGYFSYTIKEYTTEVDNTMPDATYTSQEVSKADIVFALGKLNQAEALQNYMPTFTSRVESAANYIDANVYQVETKAIDFSDQFTWNFVVNGHTHSASSGTFYGERREEGIDGSITANGNTLVFKGYGESPIYDYALYPCEQIGKLTLEFTIAETNADWHTLDYSGFNFGCASGQPHSGYYMAFTRNQLIIKGPGVSTTLNKPSGSSFKMKAIADYNSRTLTIEVNGAEVFNKSDLTFAGYEFGPFVQWGSHCCDSQSVITFSGIQMEIDSSKSLGEAIQDVQWRDGAARFIIHATDSIPTEFEDGNDGMLDYTITKLLNSNCYLINLGNISNLEYLDQILQAITQADGTVKGTNFKNSPIQTAMNNAADYIIEIMKKISKPSDWILVNTEVLWNTYYTDNEKDLPLNYGEHDGTQAQPQDKIDITLANTWNQPLTHLYTDEKLLAEKWRYRHYNNFFDNSPVQESYHLVWIEDPVEIFPNPGKYRINYKRKDNPFYTNTDTSYVFDEYRYWSGHYDYAL